MRVRKRNNRRNKILRLSRLICSLQVAAFPSGRPRNQVLQKSIPPSFIRDGFISDISRDSRTGKFLSLKDTFFSFTFRGAIKRPLEISPRLEARSFEISLKYLIL